MRILWFSVTPSLYKKVYYGGWVASLENIFRKYNNTDELGIAFEYIKKEEYEKKDNVTYFPLYLKKNIYLNVLNKIKKNYYKEKLLNLSREVINKFKPDIVQVFGSEWPFGELVNEFNIPFVIHMQGSSLIYKLSSELAFSKIEQQKLIKFNIKKYISLFLYKPNTYIYDSEYNIIKNNKYFFCRTKWDNSLIKNINNKAKILDCFEAIRDTIYYSEKWKYNNAHRIITVSQGGVLKGNEIILHTAYILKNLFNYDFEWIVTGNKDIMRCMEKKTGILCKNVNIKLIGMIDEKCLKDELLNSNIYVHASIIDNSPNSLCEAQIIGIPVIAANVGGVSSLIEDNISGILYPYNEPFQLAFDIMSLFNDINKMNDLSENERKIALKRHSKELIYNQLLNNYSYIINDYKNNKI